MEGWLIGLTGEARLPVVVVGIGRKGRKLESDLSNYYLVEETWICMGRLAKLASSMTILDSCSQFE